jgi:hypothetical protein
LSSVDENRFLLSNAFAGDALKQFGLAVPEMKENKIASVKTHMMN